MSCLESDHQFQSLPELFLFPHLITNCLLDYYDCLKIVLLTLWKDKLASNKALQDDYNILLLLRPRINF